MIQKIERSWQLFRASIAVTLRHRKLLWFPALSVALTALIALFFLAPLALPIILHPTGFHLTQKEHWLGLSHHYLPAGKSGALTFAKMPPLVSLYLLVTYFISMFLAVFFNVAFYSEIIGALNGREVSLRRGLAFARSRLPSILAWTLLAGVVGWIIRAIEARLSFIGRILTGFLGLAWSVAAVFAIPVIIQQPLRNPVKILQQSALTLKRTWGEGLIGYVGFSAASGAIFLCWLVPLLLAVGIALLLKSIWFIAVVGVLWLFVLIFLAYLSNVAADVYRCALYIYAAEGVVPGPYDRDMLDMAWKVKKS